MMSCSCWHDTLFVTCIGCVFQYLQVRKWPTRVYLCVSWNFYRTFSESPVIWIHEHVKRRSISKWPRAHTMIWVELVEREHLFQNTCPGVKQVSHKKMKAVLSTRGHKQNPEVLKLVAQSCILVLDITSDHISVYQYFIYFLYFIIMFCDFTILSDMPAWTSRSFGLLMGLSHQPAQHWGSQLAQSVSNEMDWNGWRRDSSWSNWVCPPKGCTSFHNFPAAGCRWSQ